MEYISSLFKCCDSETVKNTDSHIGPGASKTVSIKPGGGPSFDDIIMIKRESLRPVENEDLMLIEKKNNKATGSEYKGASEKATSKLESSKKIIEGPRILNAVQEKSDYDVEFPYLPADRRSSLKQGNPEEKDFILEEVGGTPKKINLVQSSENSNTKEVPRSSCENGLNKKLEGIELQQQPENESPRESNLRNTPTFGWWNEVSFREIGQNSAAQPSKESNGMNKPLTGIPEKEEEEAKEIQSPLIKNIDLNNSFGESQGSPALKSSGKSFNSSGQMIVINKIKRIDEMSSPREGSLRRHVSRKNSSRGELNSTPVAIGKVQSISKQVARNAKNK